MHIELPQLLNPEQLASLSPKVAEHCRSGVRFLAGHPLPAVGAHTGFDDLTTGIVARVMSILGPLTRAALETEPNVTLARLVAEATLAELGTSFSETKARVIIVAAEHAGVRPYHVQRYATRHASAAASLACAPCAADEHRRHRYIERARVILWMEALSFLNEHGSGALEQPIEEAA